MRPVSSVVVLLGCATACTLVTDLDGLSQPTEPTDGTSSSSSSSGPASSTSASSTSSSGGPTANTILDERFISCAGWTVSGAGKASAVAETHGDGGGSCQLCANAGDDVFLQKSVNAPRAGKAILHAYVRRASGDAPTGVTVGLASGGNTSTVGKDLGATFTLFESSTVGGGTTIPSGADVTAKVGMVNAKAGYCIVIDDITVTLN